ncbi:MAG: hypothetical protein ACREEE_09715 [Dongiaceae bacterium]
MGIRRCFAAAIAVLPVLLSLVAKAGQMEAGGLTFSDELGGFRLLSVTGVGATADPFVVIEEVTGPEEPILVIRGLDATFGNRAGTHHLVGFAMTKVVVNRTTDEWNLFDMELREFIDSQSPYGDGLSFGQASTVGRPFRSSAFVLNHEVDEPYDSISFSQGRVRPGETVSFDLIVSDTSPISPILLLQHPAKVVARLTIQAPQTAQR